MMKCKKAFCLLFLIFCSFALVSCNNTYSYDGKVTMTLTDEWLDAITYKGLVPSMSFEFDGSFNVYETSNSLGYTFTKNDNLLLSQAFEKHLNEKVGSNYCIVKQDEQSNDSPYAIFGKQRIQIDDGTKSYEYSIVTWDYTGTRYSYLYRSFTAGGVT